MKVSYRILFDRKKEATAKGKGLVQVEAYLNGTRRYFSTGIYLKPSQWNGKKGEAKDAYTQAQFRAKIAELEEVERNAVFQLKDNFTLAALVPKSKQSEQAAPALTFTEFYRQQLDAKKPKLRRVTWRSQEYCLELLTKFRPVVEFKHLNFAFVDSFEKFLFAQKYKPISVEKRLDQLKIYTNLAYRHELLSRDPFNGFNIKRSPTNRAYLLPDELKAFEALTFTPDEARLQKLRDMFLFSVYTGLRWGDVYALTTRNFIETESGLVLNSVASKTTKKIELPLSLMFEGKAGPIVRKYWSDDEKRRIFKGIPNPYANKQLKVLAERAGIKKYIVFHSARHTTGTVLSMVAGTLVAKEVLQHEKLETTAQYTHLANKDRNKALSEVNNWY